MAATLSLEGMLSGANKFVLLSMCTSLSAVISAFGVYSASNIVQIWVYGISSFIGLRFFSSALGVRHVYKNLKKKS